MLWRLTDRSGDAFNYLSTRAVQSIRFKMLQPQSCSSQKTSLRTCHSAEASLGSDISRSNAVILMPREGLRKLGRTWVHLDRCTSSYALVMYPRVFVSTNHAFAPWVLKLSETLRSTSTQTLSTYISGWRTHCIFSWLPTAVRPGVGRDAEVPKSLQALLSQSP